MPKAIINVSTLRSGTLFVIVSSSWTIVSDMPPAFAI
jgi:hypothetical protein